MKISEAIKFIVDQNDKKLLTDSKRFKSYLLDLCSDNPKELKIVKRALEDKILERIFGNERDNVKIARLRDEFEDQGMSEDWSEFVISSFAEVLDWNYTPKVQNQQSQSQPQQKQQINQQTNQLQIQSSNQTDWTCSCGTVNNGNFCGNCGKSKSVPKNTSWTCFCGTVNKTKFCTNCGKTEQESEEARRRAAEEARRKAEEEARRKAEEEARRKLEEEARRKAEEEARRKAEEEARRKAEEARRKAEEEARRKAEEEAIRKAEEEARRKAEQEARRRAEEARRKAEEEARRKAEEEARRKANPFITARVGDYVKFGSYPQTKNGDIQPIEWLVLARENNKILVISKYGLEARCFNIVSNDYWKDRNNWKNSEIRKWLNGAFYNIAFTENEKKLISSTNISTTVYNYIVKKKVGFLGYLLGQQKIETIESTELTDDKVFLLSKEEAEKYFANDEARMCKATEYAIKNGAWKHDAGYSYWWLRSPIPRTICVYTFNYGGHINYNSVDNDNFVARPALWINL